MYGLMSLLADNVIHGSDKNLSGTTIASVVITGLVVVFIGLILLDFFVSLYGKLFERLNRSKENKAKTVTEKKAENKPTRSVTPVPVIEDGIEEEAVAAIMGAIASMSAQSGKKLVLKSVKTAKPSRNSWSAAAIADYTRPF